MNKKCIFTYITSDYDKLIEPSIITPDWDYICFTDNPNIKGSRNSVWTILPLDEEAKKIKCPKRRGNSIVMQYYKYISHHYDICMIVDGNILININLDSFLDGVNYDNEIHDILVPEHPDRNCIYREANVIMRLNKDSRENIDTHIKELRREKYPKNYGLHATSVFVLNNKSKNLRILFDEWYKAYFKLSSKRDQMSFDYARWLLDKKGITIKSCYCSYYSNGKKSIGAHDSNVFKRMPHTNKSQAIRTSHRNRVQTKPPRVKKFIESRRNRRSIR